MSTQHNPAHPRSKSWPVSISITRPACRSLGWADPEGLSWLALEALEAQPAAAPEIALLAVDGFDSFTAAQRKALQLLAQTAGQVIITLPGRHPFERSAHRRFEKAYRELAAQLGVQAGSTAAQPHLPAPLREIEAQLFNPVVTPTNPGEAIRLLEARSPAEEVREALRWLKARVLRDGVALQSCAIISPNPDIYHPFLRQISTEFGIPLTFTQGETLARAPAIAPLMALLALPLRNYPRRSLLDVIRSPYFDLTAFGLDRRSADNLDLVSISGQVIEGRDQWLEVLGRLAQPGVVPAGPPEEETAAPNLPRGQTAARLLSSLDAFFQRVQPPETGHTIPEWIAWLEDLIEVLRLYSSALGEGDEVAFENFRETLRALLVGEAVSTRLAVEYTAFMGELQATLAGVGYQEPAPTNQPTAVVLRMLEARGLRFQAVAILGLSEGIFPEVERADPFLDEPLRAHLGLDSRLQRDQAGVFYQAVTRADRFLCLTRPYLAEDGEEWEPSPYWKAVQALLPGEAVQRIRADIPRAMADAASAEEALFWAVRMRKLPQAFAELTPRWNFLHHAAEVLEARRAPAPVSPYEGAPSSLAATLTARFGPGHLWSSSRLESYGACPFQFFVGSALKLDAKLAPELGLDAAQLGSLMHAILERLYASAGDPSNLEQLQAALPETAARAFAAAPAQLGFRPSPLWQTEQVQLLASLQRTLQGLAQLDAGSGWMPVGFEQAFGRAGIPPLEIKIGDETIRLAGIIDRIDQNAAGEVRIIDYKTGSSHLGKQDLITGRRLQLPIYTLAVRGLTDFGEPIEGIYWTLLRGEAGPLKLSRFEYESYTGLDGAIALALEHIAAIIAGIRQAAFSPQPPKGGCPGYCPAHTWCWRYSGEWRAA